MDLFKCHRRCSRFQLALILVLIINYEVPNASAEADPCATNNTCRFEPQYPECPIEERIKLNEIKCYKCVGQGEKDVNKCQVVQENQLETCKRPDPVCYTFFFITRVNERVNERGCKSKKCANTQINRLGLADVYFFCEGDKCNNKSKYEDFITTTAKMSTTAAKMNSKVGILELNVGLLISLILFGISLWFGHLEVIIMTS